MNNINNDITKVDYVFCFPGKNFSSNFLESWTSSITSLMKEPISWAFLTHYTPIVSFTRNEMIRFNFKSKERDFTKFEPFENKLEAKKIIFIDHDMVWNYEDLKKILKSKEDIISGFYKKDDFNSYNGHELCAQVKNKWLTETDIKDKKELIELDGVGFGFIAINFEIFKKLPFPWFESFSVFNKENNEMYGIGEDVYFCESAKSHGYKIYGDPTIKLGHEKTKILGF